MKHHHELQPHHKYQLEVVFLFVIGLFLYAPYIVFVENILAVNMNTWQWYFFWPWLTIYLGYSLTMRNKIKPQEYIPSKKRHLAYWILLGIILLLWLSGDLPLTRPVTVYYMYAIFTLLLADSYWSFR